LLPDLAPEGVMREPVAMLGESIGVHALDGLHDPLVQTRSRWGPES